MCRIFGHLGHLDNTEAGAGAGVGGVLPHEAHTEDPDVPPGGPPDQELQRPSLVASEAPLVDLLPVPGQAQAQRAGLHQEGGGHCPAAAAAAACHPAQ